MFCIIGKIPVKYTQNQFINSQLLFIKVSQARYQQSRVVSREFTT